MKEERRSIRKGKGGGGVRRRGEGGLKRGNSETQGRVQGEEGREWRREENKNKQDEEEERQRRMRKGEEEPGEET